MSETGNFRVEGTLTGPIIANFSGSVGTSYNVDGVFGVVFNAANSHVGYPTIVVGPRDLTGSTAMPGLFNYRMTSDQVYFGLISSALDGFNALKPGNYIEFSVTWN